MSDALQPIGYAFWKYDLFPYCLGSEIEDLGENGRVAPKGYGGYSFQYQRITDLKTGQRLKAQLEEIKKDYEAEIAAAKNRGIRRLQEIGLWFN